MDYGLGNLAYRLDFDRGMTNEQIGGIIFWILFAALVLAFLGLLLGIRIRISARALVVVVGIPAAVGAFSWAAANLPPEIVGGWLTWGLLGGMCFGLLWALTRGR